MNDNSPSNPHTGLPHTWKDRLPAPTDEEFLKAPGRKNGSSTMPEWFVGASKDPAPKRSREDFYKDFDLLLPDDTVEDDDLEDDDLEDDANREEEDDTVQANEEEREAEEQKEIVAEKEIDKVKKVDNDVETDVQKDEVKETYTENEKDMELPEYADEPKRKPVSDFDAARAIITTGLSITLPANR